MLIFLIFWGKVGKSNWTIEQKQLSSPKSEVSLLIQKVDQSLQFANRKTSFPAPWKIRFFDGMSGQRFRAFLNHLSKSLGDYLYLEVGVWKGSTATCALFESKARATLIDDWSEFGGPEKKARKRLAKYTKQSRVELINSSLNQVNFKILEECPKIYFYDGAHDLKSHLEATKIIENFNCNALILIVDDWNWENVREGTLSALSKSKYKVFKEWQIFPSVDDRGGRFGSWHNGTFICVLGKC